MKISKLTDEQLHESLYRLLTRIHFINELQIPEKIWLKAESLTTDIDPDDTDFVALAIYLKAMLWTGDKELFGGLKQKGFKKIIITPELLNLRNRREEF